MDKSKFSTKEIVFFIIGVVALILAIVGFILPWLTVKQNVLNMASVTDSYKMTDLKEDIVFMYFFSGFNETAKKLHGFWSGLNTVVLVVSILGLVLSALGLISFVVYKFADMKFNKVSYYCSTAASVCAIPVIAFVLFALILCSVGSENGTSLTLGIGAYMHAIALITSAIFALKCVTKPKSTAELK